MRRVAGWLAATLAACAGPAGVADPGPVEHLAAPAGALGPYSGSVAASGLTGAISWIDWRDY